MTKRSIVILNSSDEESMSSAKNKYNMLPSTPRSESQWSSYCIKTGKSIHSWVKLCSLLVTCPIKTCDKRQPNASSPDIIHYIGLNIALVLANMARLSFGPCKKKKKLFLVPANFFFLQGPILKNKIFCRD